MTAPSRGLAVGRWLSVVVIVAQREVVVRVRTRVYAAGSVAMVALVVVGIVLASLVGGSSASAAIPTRVGFSVGTKALEPTFTTYAAALGEAVTVSDVADPESGRAQVVAGTLDMLVTGSAASPAALLGDAVPDNVVIALDAAAQVARLGAAGLPADEIASIMAAVPTAEAHAAPSGPSAEQTQSIVAALGVAILLMVALSTYGTVVAQGVVEEKATRIVEIMLSTVRPSQLLAGKVVGIGLVGLLQLAFVGAAALIAARVTGVASIPALSIATVASSLLWFTLGFLLFATADAALAALVSRPEEVQGVIAPVSLAVGVSYILVFITLPDPTTPLVTILSILPPLAPVLMSVRIALGAAQPWQAGLAVVLTIAGIIGLMRLAGRVYANSVLRFGARVRLADALQRRQQP